MGDIFGIQQVQQKRTVQHVVKSALPVKIETYRHSYRCKAEDPGKYIGQQICPLPVMYQNNNNTEQHGADTDSIVEPDQRDEPQKKPIDVGNAGRMLFLPGQQEFQFEKKSCQNERHAEFLCQVAVLEQIEKCRKERESGNCQSRIEQ